MTLDKVLQVRPGRSPEWIEPGEIAPGLRLAGGEIHDESLEILDHLVATWRRVAPWTTFYLVPEVLSFGLEKISGYGMKSDQWNTVGGVCHYVQPHKIVAVSIANTIYVLGIAHHELMHAVDNELSYFVSNMINSNNTIYPSGYARCKSEILARRYAAFATFLDEGGGLLRTDGRSLGEITDFFIAVYDGTYAKDRATGIATQKAAEEKQARRAARVDRLKSILPLSRRGL